jgi:hypothetical protein
MLLLLAFSLLLSCKGQLGPFAGRSRYSLPFPISLSVSVGEEVKGFTVQANSVVIDELAKFCAEVSLSVADLPAILLYVERLADELIQNATEQGVGPIVASSVVVGLNNVSSRIVQFVAESPETAALRFLIDARLHLSPDIDLDLRRVVAALLAAASNPPSDSRPPISDGRVLGTLMAAFGESNYRLFAFEGESLRESVEGFLRRTLLVSAVSESDVQVLVAALAREVESTQLRIPIIIDGGSGGTGSSSEETDGQRGAGGGGQSVTITFPSDASDMLRARGYAAEALARLNVSTTGEAQAAGGPIDLLANRMVEAARNLDILLGRAGVGTGFQQVVEGADATLSRAPYDLEVALFDAQRGYIPVKKGNVLSQVAASVCTNSLPEISDAIGTGSFEEVKEAIRVAEEEFSAGEVDGPMTDLIGKITSECVKQVQQLLTAAYVDGAGAEDATDV